MSFTNELDFENDYLLGKGKNVRKNRAKCVENTLCQNFMLKDEKTGRPNGLPWKVLDSYIIGPACNTNS